MRRERRKRNSFTDMIIVIFVVLVCFGLTIYGIVYLTGKIFGVEETVDNITVASNPVTANPEEGDVIIYNDNETFTDTTTNMTIGDNVSVIRSEKYPNIIETVPTRPDAGLAVPPAREIANGGVANKPAAQTNNATAQKPNPKPISQNKPKETPAETKVASLDKGDFVVQIMAVKSQSAAETEAIKYRNTCPDVFIQRADLKEKGVWYRIRCGVSATKADAEIIKKRLESSFKVAPTIVPNK